MLGQSGWFDSFAGPVRCVVSAIGHNGSLVVKVRARNNRVYRYGEEVTIQPTRFVSDATHILVRKSGNWVYRWRQGGK